METSVLPRVVVDLTFKTPGTTLTASSTGTVASIAMRSAGLSPASILMTIRGKITCGNKLTGKDCAPYNPARAANTRVNKIERR